MAVHARFMSAYHLGLTGHAAVASVGSQKAEAALAGFSAGNDVNRGCSQHDLPS